MAKLRENAKIEVENNYDWDCCLILRYLSLYQNLLKNNEVET